LNAAASASLDVEVRPPWPFRLPARGGGDRVTSVRNGVVARFLHVDGRPVLVRACQPAKDRVALRAEAVDPAAIELPETEGQPAGAEPAGSAQLELAIERMRFALGVDEDLGPFYRQFRSDRLIGSVIRRLPHLRPRRRPWPWEALAWAVTSQLIEAMRASEIQRRIVRRWGPSLGSDAVWSARPRSRTPPPLRDVPCAAVIAGRAPAELRAMDLAAARALALRRSAREVAAGRSDLFDPACDRRLRAIPEIGPWTLQCLGLHGRGDPDSLPAGDVAYIKLVGRLAGLGRRATVEEVEEFYAPYAPYRALAGYFSLVGHHRVIAQGPRLRRAPDRFED
jgi:3-methyladenine DNA glycosylase/8-oxoguanine DNA glycosylase